MAERTCSELYEVHAYDFVLHLALPQEQSNTLLPSPCDPRQAFKDLLDFYS